jgi:hypothetical protein
MTALARTREGWAELGRILPRDIGAGEGKKNYYYYIYNAIFNAGITFKTRGSVWDVLSRTE